MNLVRGEYYRLGDKVVLFWGYQGHRKQLAVVADGDDCRVVSIHKLSPL